MNLIDIKSPADLKGLSISELTDLTAQARQALMTKVSEHGGHFGPPMGVAEMIMALHYVFNSPVDKIVYDVSHQSYVHKMVTGRALAFLDHDHYDDVTGYTDPTESEHDFFNIGHTSTSISLASGLATARNLKGDSENIIAIIGDGSLSGGEAFEGLDYAATLDSNMIIIVNDNDQSIAENHGGLYRGLRELRESNGESSNNIFKALGLDYRFVADGNDLETLINVFKAVKDINHPIVLHIVTQKGKGYAIAEQNKEAFHWTRPFDLETGKLKKEHHGPTYAGTIADYLMEQIKADPTVVAIIAGTPGGLGFNSERRKEAGKQYIDVGIAEEHAIAMSSGIAKNGGKPVFNVYSTFLQRTYDQLVQDLCVNNNSAVIINHMASVYGMNDVTHLGFFDIPMLTNIPNLVYLAPTSNEELLAMTEYAVHQHEHPVAIRVPVGEFTSTGVADTTDYSILNKSEVTRRGERIALLGLGNFYHLANQVADALAKDGINATVVNPKFVTEYTSDDLSANSLIVVCGDRNKVIDYNNIYESTIDYQTYSSQTTGFDGEGQITSAIGYVTSEDLPILYTLEGHGEKEMDSTIKEDIEKANMDIQSLNLLTEGSVPDDADCLFIDSPSTDISEDEKTAIIDYLENGGKAMIFSDYTTEDLPNFDAVLENYGVQREAGIVFEGDNQHYAMQMPYYLVPTINSTDASSETVSGGYYVLVPYAQGIKKMDDVRDTVTINSILTTSDQAYSKTDLNSDTLEKEDGDEAGPFDLGVSITETLDDDKETQIVYYSTSNLMESQVNQMVSGGNEKLIIESLKWMTDTEDSATVSIPSKSLSVSNLTLTDYDAAFWKICTIGLIPGFFLVVGFAVWMKRRKA